jgi:hypothetical protein
MLLSMENENIPGYQNIDPNQFGNVYFDWQVDERPRYERGVLWYITTFAVGAGLLIYSVIVANFLFALIIVMFALIMYLTNMRTPRQVDFRITDMGLMMGDNFYPYKDIRRYWFIYDPPAIKNLYIEFKSSLSPRLCITMEEMNPNLVREVLSQFIYEDFSEDEEPLSDFLARLLKI